MARAPRADKKLTPEMIVDAVDAYHAEDRPTIAELAQRYNVGYGTMSRALNLVTQTRGRGRKGQNVTEGAICCSNCRQWKPRTTDFFHMSRHAASGFVSVCKDCSPFYSRTRRYKITREKYNALLAEQNGKCPICRRTASEVTTPSHPDLVVDHDHTTGAVRGLLCSRCNNGIGLFKDDPWLLINAVQYLERKV